MNKNRIKLSCINRGGKFMKDTHNIAYKRILDFVDECSFVELFEAVTCRTTDMTIKECQDGSDGVVTGYGLINGRLVFLYSQNPDVLHGSLGEMHCRKIVQVYAQAMKMGAPVIAMLDSSGMRLQEGVDALTGFGEVINAVSQASGVIPLYSVIYGNCGGGLSLIPAMSDFTYMIEGEGRLFVNSPNTIDNNYQEKLDTADGAFQGLYSGVVDDCVSAQEAADRIRSLILMLPSNNTEGSDVGTLTDDLNRLVEGMNSSNYEAKVLIANLADNFEFLETKTAFAPELVTGFIRLNGITVGVAANKEGQTRLTTDALSKGAEFVRFCDAYELPLLFIGNVCGFDTTLEAEKSLSKAMSRFAAAVCEADVPKVTLLTGQAYGTASLLMNSKALGADFVYAWPEAQPGILPSKQAVDILYPEKSAAERKEEQDRYSESHNSVNAFAKRAQIDGIIEPASTRKYLVSAFDLLYTKYACVQDKKHSLR